MFCDAHEAKLTKACEILEGANLVGIERHFAECKAKDERIAELFSELSATYVKCYHKDIENKRLKGRIAKLEAKLDSLAQFLEGEGAVFRGITDCIDKTLMVLSKPYA